MFDDILETEEKKREKIIICCICGKTMQKGEIFISVDKDFYTCSDTCALVFDDLFANLKIK